MMKNKSELSTEELKSKAKTMKWLITVFGGMLIVMLFASMVSMIHSGFNIFVVLPIALLPLFSVLLNQLKKVQAEIDNRK